MVSHIKQKLPKSKQFFSRAGIVVKDFVDSGPKTKMVSASKNPAMGKASLKISTIL